MATNITYNLPKLREILARASVDELKVFCFDLGMDYDSIVGKDTTKPLAAAQIVDAFDKRGRIPELVERVRREFPSAEWSAIDLHTLATYQKFVFKEPTGVIERTRLDNLLRFVLSKFDQKELELLSHRMQISYSDLRGSDLTQKMYSLVILSGRTQRLGELTTNILALRPDLEALLNPQ
jgi:hypothetical protein